METKSNSPFIEDDSLEWEKVDEFISRKIMGYDDKLMTVKVAFKKGGVGALHHHHHSQTSYVASGSFEITIGGETRVLKEGDVYYVPSNISHGAVALEDGVLIDSFSPMRADFL
jgi:quercetin dioxygenase-like cupin family protein